MNSPNNAGLERAGHPSELAGVLSGETTWILRLTAASEGLTDTVRALGADPASVRAVGQSGLPVLVRGPGGSARASVAWCLASHAGTRNFQQVNGCIVGAERALRSLLKAGLAKPEVSVLFVDNFSALENDLREELLSLVANDRGQGRPRIILGATHGDATDGAEQCTNLIEIAPLSARKQMIPAIMRQWLSSEKGAPRISDEAMRILKTWPWIGDMTELRVLLDRLPLMRHGPIITGDQLGELLCSDRNPAEEVRRPLADVEREHILRVLDAQNWNRTQTAQLLGIDVKTLYNKLKRYETLRAETQKQGEAELS